MRLVFVAPYIHANLTTKILWTTMNRHSDRRAAGVCRVVKFATSGGVPNKKVTIFGISLPNMVMFPYMTQRTKTLPYMVTFCRSIKGKVLPNWNVVSRIRVLWWCILWVALQFVISLPGAFGTPSSCPDCYFLLFVSSFPVIQHSNSAWKASYVRSTIHNTTERSQANLFICQLDGQLDIFRARMIR